MHTITRHRPPVESNRLNTAGKSPCRVTGFKWSSNTPSEQIFHTCSTFLLIVVSLLVAPWHLTLIFYFTCHINAGVVEKSRWFLKYENLGCTSTLITIPLNERVDKHQWGLLYYILSLATVLCLHRNKYCMELLTSSRRIPVRHYTTTWWQHACWWLLNTNKSKARHSATTVAVQWERKWANHTKTHKQISEHTHGPVSAVFGQFSSVLYPQQKDHRAVSET